MLRVRMLAAGELALSFEPRSLVKCATLLIAIVASTVPAVQATADVCPENCIIDVRRGRKCSTAAAAESSYFGRGPRDCGFDASYDLRVGILRASIGCGFESDGVRVQVADDFSIAGLTGEGPLAFEVIMSILADGTPGRSWVQGSIVEGPRSTSASFPLDGPRDTTLVLQLFHGAGEEFRLQFTLQADSFGESSSQAVATYRFRGLPTGGFATSCQGYQDDPSTRVRGQTWGRLKTTYR